MNELVKMWDDEILKTKEMSLQIRREITRLSELEPNSYQESKIIYYKKLKKIKWFKLSKELDSLMTTPSEHYKSFLIQGKYYFYAHNPKHTEITLNNLLKLENYLIHHCPYKNSNIFKFIEEAKNNCYINCGIKN